MTKSRDTEIISVGTELLLGRVVNTDARDISEMLSKIGINVKYHTVVGDNPDRLKAAKDVKFRIFHGDADNVVPVNGSRQAYKALKAAGADVEYKEFPGVTHGSWNPAFSLPDFMSWLFSQKKE